MKYMLVTPVPKQILETDTLLADGYEPGPAPDNP
jgi:hypothetical protein